ncbi:FMN-binding protein [uncultured Prevotella sp.]|uniref:FMN-binding protein n=1 Tax=uncultured Prevotella sp. TaxID=159272 RepID=UPI002614E1D3|nr:FMN-binding protein [uncultured Prevotella sp.]
MKQNNAFIQKLMSLFFIVCMLSIAAMNRDNKLFGYDFGESDKQSAAVAVNNDTLSVQPDGSFIVNTKPLAKDVQGYGGPVPLRIHVSKDGVVAAIEAEPNAETPDFFNQAKLLLTRWQGKTVDVAMAETDKVDAVSGATFSSNAIIANMQRGLAYANRHTAQSKAATDASGAILEGSGSSSASGWTIGGIAALIVVLLGAIVPLFYKSRRWHKVQLVLNVVVLGLWTGTFVSFTLLMRLFSGGLSLAALATLAAPLLMVVVALFYPLAGKPGHYCAHVCPFGSAQELAGKLTRRKLRVPVRLNKALNMFRTVLWAVLMVLLLTGTWVAWIDYELFTAFLYSSASVWVVVLAVLFLVLSVWVPRPYCRYVCPTGTLLRGFKR